MIERLNQILLREIYGTATYFATPLVFGYFYWRGRREPDYRKRWGERLGLGPVVAGRPIWIHAASVGEVGLAEPLVRALHERNPDRAIIVTTFTPTGAERVRARLGDIASHCYLPLDTMGATRRFMRRINPTCGVIIETELWPNLLRAAATNDIPILLANASVSARSARRYRNVFLAPLMRLVMANVTAIGAASQEHAHRFVELGAPTDRVHVTGNLKYDVTPDPGLPKEGAALRAAWHAQNRPVWVAASTHEGEEALILEAHRTLRKTCTDALLILAPRHPQRFQAVAELLDKDGWRYVSHADQAQANPNTEVILGNTLGDVPQFYAASDVAFVGGSLVPGIGGHNMLEPALLGRPVLVGPNVTEWQEVADILVNASGARVAETPEQLAECMQEWLINPNVAQGAGQRAKNAAQKEQGALQQTLELLEKLVK